MICPLPATLPPAGPGSDEVALGVLVPAIMGAGLVFSLATLLRDLVERSTHLAADRTAAVRGRFAAGEVLGHPGQAAGDGPLWRRGVLAVAGTAGITFALYLLIGATYNYFNPGGYLHGVAWLWSGSLFLVATSAALGIIALLGATRGDVPGWSWSALLHTPLVAPEVRSPRQDRLRWMGIAAAAALVVVSIMLANPGMMWQIDSALAEPLDAPWVPSMTPVATWVGSPLSTLALLGLTVVGLTILTARRCARVARLLVPAVLLGFAVSLTLGGLTDRAAPSHGPWPDAEMSYPSGSVTQVTMLALLLPLAGFALCGRMWVQHLLAAASGAALVFLAVNQMAVGVHWPTDVLAGVLLGLAIGLWTRAALLDPAPHRSCRRCAFRTAAEVGTFHHTAEGDDR